MPELKTVKLLKVKRNNYLLCFRLFRTLRASEVSVTMNFRNDKEESSLVVLVDRRKLEATLPKLVTVKNV